MDGNVDIGQKIKYFREERNLSVDEFAKLIGISQTQILKIEAGDTNFNLLTLEKILTVLDIKLRIIKCNELLRR